MNISFRKWVLNFQSKRKNRFTYLYVLDLSSQMPEITAPSIPEMTMVKPILPAFTSSPWENHSPNNHPVKGQDTDSTVTMK